MNKSEFLVLLNHLHESSKKINSIDFLVNENDVVLKYSSGEIESEKKMGIDELYNLVDVNAVDVNKIKEDVLNVMSAGMRLDARAKAFKKSILDFLK